MTLQADHLILEALKEDISSEDVSTNAVMPEAVDGEVELICKQDGVIAGLDVFKRVFELLDADTEVAFFCKDGDEVKGNQVRVKVVKNKVAPPFRKAEFDIMFGEGISRSGEIIDLGSELGIIKKSGSWYSYNDAKLGQGRDAAKQCIADNPELADELAQLIFQALKG